MVNSAGTSPQERRGLIGRIARSQGLLLPWCLSLVLSILVAVFAPAAHRWEWFAAMAGVAIVITFLVQITIARADGFILRASTSALGSVLIVGIVSLVTALFTAAGHGSSVFAAGFGLA